MALLGSLIGSAFTNINSNVMSSVKSTIANTGIAAIGQAKSAVNVDLGNVVDSVTVVAKKKVETDLRVRLRAQPNQEDIVYGESDPTNNVLSILHDTNGIIFPYTPTISFTQDVEYKSFDLIHSNYDFNAYTRTPNASINVSGKFTVQSAIEGSYAVAVLHFLRTVSKMYFGEADASAPTDQGQKGARAGLPPPTLIFSGHGTYMFNDLKVILKSHSYTFDDTVDMVTVVTDDGYKTRLPSVFTISLNLGIQKSPTETRKFFSLDDFRRGELMRKGGWI